jgi:diaminopimelate epimerase
VQVVFDKIEGLGNDFIVVARDLAAELDDARVRALCDRHRGVGADGVLIVDPGVPSMRVVNADGSHPEMCGNGIRCVMLWLARRGAIGVGATLVIDTEAGPHACTLLGCDERHARVRVAMRPYAIDPDPALVRSDGPLLDARIDVDARHVVGSFVSMGNPHFVIFDAEAQRAAELAPAIERHPRFPARINVGLAEITGPSAIALRVFERGVGYTEACGTGACAAAAAAVETGRMPRGVPITVTLPGGPLEIVVRERGEPIDMTGPARHVFRGEL